MESAISRTTHNGQVSVNVYPTCEEETNNETIYGGIPYMKEGIPYMKAYM